MRTIRGGRGDGARRSVRRRAAGLGLAVVTAATAMSVAAPAAHADTVTKWQRQNSNICLGGEGRIGLNVYCDINADIRWNVHRWQDGTYELRHIASNMCLDDSNAYGLRAFPCNKMTYQSWWLHRWRDGTTQIKNQATLRCLDQSSYGMRTYPCNATVYQSWWGTW
ncbi:RICIN domain-containing protein [Actinomadura sp. 3N508]|uniref:RICIN domain-containing protein n=1 Tax=Actinomadura sp. 3N508 TaxID=3375153 RepID=UPI0037B4025F